MATEYDNRIKYPPTLIDFFNDVGITGQDHDNFPAPGQARYDTMRLELIGLLSCQSSFDPPTQYRTGTIWFNRTKQAYYCWNGSAWVSPSELILVEDDSGGTVSLQQWHDAIQDKLSKLFTKHTFSGRSSINNVTLIPVPLAIQSVISSLLDYLRPIVYVNGKLLDPRLCALTSSCPVSVILDSTVKLQAGDKFTVMIDRFDEFVIEDVIIN